MCKRQSWSNTSSIFDFRFSMLDVRCSMFDVRCSMLNVRCLTFGFPERRRLEQIEFSVFQNNNVRNLIRYTVTNSNTICKKVPYIILTVKSTESTVCEENLNESIPILSVSHMSTTYQNSLGAGKERRTLRQHNYLKKGSTRHWNYVEDYILGNCTRRTLGSERHIGTQLGDLMNSGLARWWLAE